MSDTERGSFVEHKPCGCEQCARTHGDPALTSEEVLIDQLRAENAGLKEKDSEWQRFLDAACLCAGCATKFLKVSGDEHRKHEAERADEQLRVFKALVAERNGAISEAAMAKRERDSLRIEIDEIRKLAEDEFLGSKRNAAEREVGFRIASAIAETAALRRERDSLRNQRNDLIVTLTGVAEHLDISDWTAIAEDPSVVLRGPRLV